MLMLLIVPSALRSESCRACCRSHSNRFRWRQVFIVPPGPHILAPQADDNSTQRMEFLFLQLVSVDRAEPASG